MLDMPCIALGGKYFTVVLGDIAILLFVLLLDKTQEVMVPSCSPAATAFCKAWTPYGSIIVKMYL